MSTVPVKSTPAVQALADDGSTLSIRISVSKSVPAPNITVSLVLIHKNSQIKFFSTSFSLKNTIGNKNLTGQSNLVKLGQTLFLGFDKMCSHTIIF